MKHTIETLLRTKRFSVVEHQVLKSDGSLATCAAVQHPGAVVILPLVDPQRVCLIRNQRLTVGGTLLELPAGTREAGEAPDQTALRELREETGYRAGELTKLGEFYTSPGVLDERMHAYVARGLVSGEPDREDNEEIENLLVTWTAVNELIDRGEICDAKTLVTLLLYWRRFGEEERAIRL